MGYDRKKSWNDTIHLLKLSLDIHLKYTPHFAPEKPTKVSFPKM